jgi:hypothetical protein
MSKISHTGFVLLLLLFLGSSTGNYASASAKATAAKAQLKQNSPESQPARRSIDEGGTGTLQKMIVENGSVTMDLDLDRLNGISSVTGRPATLHFAHADGNCHGNPDAYGNLYTNADGHSYSHFNSYSNCNGNGNSYTNSNCNTKAYPYAKV